MRSRPSPGAPLLAFAIVVGACTGGPGPLPDDQTGGTSSPSGSGRGEKSPSTAEAAASTTENPPADDDGTDDGSGDESEQHDGG